MRKFYSIGALQLSLETCLSCSQIIQRLRNYGKICSRLYVIKSNKNLPSFDVATIPGVKLAYDPSCEVLHSLYVVVDYHLAGCHNRTGEFGQY